MSNKTLAFIFLTPLIFSVTVEFIMNVGDNSHETAAIWGTIMCLAFWSIYFFS